MTTTPSVRLDVETENWQLNEIQAGVEELDKGQGVEHAAVATWLRSWGKAHEREPPRR